MLVRRFGVSALSALFVFGSSLLPLDAASGDKQLARVKGIVGYQAAPNAPFKAIFGRLDLPDDAVAVTQTGAQAVLRLKDSSEIDIGQNTSVQVGSFNAVDTGKQNEIVLNNGALHFNIRHPQGGQSNYKFTTATSQIAVRGTEGFLLSSASGTQVVCVSCAAGDITVQTGGQVTSIVSGQTAVIAGSSAGNASVTVVSNSSVGGNPAVNQFNQTNSVTSSTTTSTTTSTASSAGTSATTSTTTSVAGSSAGTVATVAGAGAVTTVVVAAAVNNSNPSPQPSASAAPTSTPSPTPGSIIASFSVGGANSAFASFPQTFQLNATQLNATTGLTVNAGPASVITNVVTNQTSGPPNLAASVTGSVIAPGALVLSLSASGVTVGPVTINIYGAVTSNPASLSFTQTGSQTSQSVTISQPGPGPISLTASRTCVAGADMSFQPSSGASPLTVTVVANSAPSSPSTTAACTLNVTGQGTGPAASLAIPVNITTTQFGVSNTKRSNPSTARSPH